MDLRPYVTSKSQLERAKKLAFSGKLVYQPFVLADDFATGAGLSILHGADNVPFVYAPKGGDGYAPRAHLEKTICKPEQVAAFTEANDRLDRFYGTVVDQVSRHLGGLDGKTVLDVGCNSGYFPAAFALRGARMATGFDRVDYSGTFDLLRDLLGVPIRFENRSYNGEIVAPLDHGRFDLVLSIAVLVHLSDPLQHLSYLGSLARRALFAFTPCHDTDDYTIKFHNVNRYYANDEFPYCFDTNTMSKKLMRLAFERMGFHTVHEIAIPPEIMPPAWSHVHLGLLGIRDTPREILPRDSRGTIGRPAEA